MTGFARLIDPLAVDEFFATHRDRVLFVRPAGDPDRYDDVLDLATVEGFIFEGNPRGEHLQMLSEGRVASSSYLYPSGLVDGVAVGRLFSDGCSIVLPQAHQHLRSLAVLVRGLEAELGCRVQANVYLSPPGESSFAPHFDAHDVFALQIHGAKHWTVFEGTDAPATERFDPTVHAPGPPQASFCLEPGGLAYLPRGLMHHAKADGTSLHVTIGVHWVSYFDVLQRVVRDLDREVDLRRAAPREWWRPGDARADLVDHLEGSLAALVHEDTVTRAVERLRRELVATRQPLLPGHLHQLDRLETLDGDTTVGRRDPMLWDLEDAEDGADGFVLSCFGSTIEFPSAARPAVVQLLADQSDGIRVVDLEGPLDTDEKLVLVRRLVVEGVVELR